MFWSTCPSAFFRCIMLNSGVYTEPWTESFIYIYIWFYCCTNFLPKQIYNHSINLRNKFCLVVFILSKRSFKVVELVLSCGRQVVVPRTRHQSIKIMDYYKLRVHTDRWMLVWMNGWLDRPDSLHCIINLWYTKLYISLADRMSIWQSINFGLAFIYVSFKLLSLQSSSSLSLLLLLYHYQFSPVRWDCRIHQLILCRGVRFPQ